MISETIIKKALQFPNGHRAIALLPSSKKGIDEIVTALGLNTYKAVMVVLGGADNMDQKLVPVLSRLFEQGIAKAAVETTAIIIDGGTKAGIMEMMGKGVAGCGYISPLIGVAPLKKISLPEEGDLNNTPLDPNHSYFVLVEGDDWGSETATLFNLAKSLAGKVPAMAILVGGGKVAKNELLRAVRQKLYIIIVLESGGLADEINAALKNKQALPPDAVMSEIIADGDIHFFSPGGSPESMEKQVIAALR